MNVQVLIPKEAATLASELGLESVRSLAIVTDRRPVAGKVQVALMRPQTRFEPFADTIRRAIKLGRLHKLEATMLVPVGIFDDYAGELRVEPRYISLLQRHLGRPVNRHEIEASDSRQQQRQQARRDARCAHMQGNFAREARIRSEHQIWYW